MTETVLITGSNGLVGHKVVSVLAGRPNLQVVAASRGANRNPSQMGYRYESIDLADGPAVHDLFQQLRPQAVIHCAGMTQPDACERDPEASHAANVLAVQHLVNACAANGTYLIHMSTDFVFDGAAGPYVETDKPNPVSTYGRHKLEAEQVVQLAARPAAQGGLGLQAAIIRTVLVYGITPGLGRRNFVLWVRESLLGRQPIRVVDDQWRTPTLVDDLADAIATCWSRRRTGLYHVSGAEMVSVYELAVRVAAFWQLDASLIEAVKTANLEEAAKRPPRTGFLILRAQSELGYRPRSLQEGLTVLDRQLPKG